MTANMQVSTAAAAKRCFFIWSYLFITNGYGRESPDFERTTVVSPTLMKPSTFTSYWKLVGPTVAPDRLRTWIVSPALTTLSPLTSPLRKPTFTLGEVLSVFVPDTLFVDTARVCWSVTPVRAMIMLLPLKLTLLTFPVPEATLALPELTAWSKVSTMV